jgi:tRNA pseudouridine13 synthase
MPQLLPYLTADLPGIGGRLKERPEDFRVEEIPLYLPQSTGTHLYFRVTKQGIATPAAVERIARHMGVKPGDIGVAGLKDAQAVTTQMMSLEHAASERLAAFRDEQISVSVLGIHSNKLRTGHLKGNRFIIRLRGVGQEATAQTDTIVQILAKRGVPNFFGEQRFGRRGDTALLGAAMVRGKIEEFVNILLGRPQPEDPQAQQEARQAFARGDGETALRLWPYHERERRAALAAYLKQKRPQAAVAALTPKSRRLYVSALQSEIFNEVLQRRLASFDQVMAGDLAQREGSCKFFVVEDVAAELARAAAFEISASGPMVGMHCPLPQGQPGEVEQAVWQAFQLTPEDFSRVGKTIAQGTRRPLRFRLAKPHITAGEDCHGSFLELSFVAPSGCYATVVLREIMKQDPSVGQESAATPASDCHVD